MTKETLFAAIGEADEKMIKEAGEILASERKKKNVTRWVVSAAAACAAVALVAIPLSKTVTLGKPALHSYVVGSDTATYNTLTAGGFTEDGAESSIEFPAEVEDDPNADGGKEEFTGEYFGGAVAPDPDAPVTEDGVRMYQNLMEHFYEDCGAGKYPDWYGGAYIVDGDYLIINIADEELSMDKEFLIGVQNMAGSDRVGFGEVPHSYNELLEIQEKLVASPELTAIGNWGCGIDDSAAKVELSLPYADEGVLKLAKELDPDDTAILITVGAEAATLENSDGLATGTAW